MKKRILPVIMAACGLFSAACVNEVEELFDTPSSERLDERMLECQNLLISAEYGWQIRYYPSSQQSFGGSTYTAKFEADGNVTVTGEIAQQMTGDVSKTITSHYSINASSSVVLTFDTYNEYIHFWSDPDFYSGNVYDGDFEFAYVSGDAEQMIFRGIKTDNRIVFTALDTDIVSSARQIAAVQADVVDKLFLGFKLNTGGAEQVELFDDDNANLLTYYPDGDVNGAYETIPYSYTSEGISFYRTVTIDGITMQNFKWENGQFTSIDAETASGESVTVSMEGYHSENFLHYDAFIGDYVLMGNGAPYSVSLSERVRYSSYTFSISLLDGGNERVDFEVEVGYSKSNGSLSMLAQYLAPYGPYYAWFCPWDATLGYYTWTTTIGFTISHNGDPDNLVLTFADNGVWGSNEANSVIFRAFTTPSGGSSVGNIARIAFLQTMTKQ